MKFVIMKCFASTGTFNNLYKVSKSLKINRLFVQVIFWLLFEASSCWMADKRESERGIAFKNVVSKQSLVIQQICNDAPLHSLDDQASHTHAKRFVMFQ